VTPLLELRDLNVYYGAIRALKNVSLKVEEGQIVALLGCNGAGKSTTLRAVSGLLRPRSGAILFDGKSIAGRRTHDIAAMGLAHVPEGRGIFANLTVRENLELGAYRRRDRAGIDQDRERALELFPRVRERLAQRAGTLSGGEQQMLAIARALMARPRLLMLDEPSLGLAPQIVRVIFQIVSEINKAGTTVLLVEQNAHIALKHAHRGSVLEVGEIAMEDTAAALEASPQVREAYLGIRAQ